MNSYNAFKNKPILAGGCYEKVRCTKRSTQSAESIDHLICLISFESLNDSPSFLPSPRFLRSGVRPIRGALEALIHSEREVTQWHTHQNQPHLRCTRPSRSSSQGSCSKSSCRSSRSSGRAYLPWVLLAWSKVYRYTCSQQYPLFQIVRNCHTQNPNRMQNVLFFDCVRAPKIPK